MEDKINSKIINIVNDFKLFASNEITNSFGHLPTECEHILDIIQKYEYVPLNGSDFQKRMRATNSIPLSNRCCAKLANNKQCTRRTKVGNFCGTHQKGIPNGLICEDTIQEQPNNNDSVSSEKNNEESKQVKVWKQDIRGILCYIDDNKNVYSSEDIMNNIKIPRVVAFWEKTDEKYTILKKE